MTQRLNADVVVIGMGPGGEHVANSLAEAGLTVVGVEAELVGGVCPYWGCVPSKMAIRAGNLLAEARRIPGLAGSVDVQPDWGPVAQRIRAEATDTWDDTVAAERFEGKGGHLLRGRGRILRPGVVRVEQADGGTTDVEAARIVVATGSTAAVPPIDGLEDPWTNREAMEAEELPASLAVLGGGAVGVELGQVFARFGVKITIIEASDRLVPMEEPEVGSLLQQVLEAEGVDVHVGVKAERVSSDGQGRALHLSDGSKVVADRVLVATGRKVDVTATGLEQVGVDPEAKSAPVDDRLRVTDDVWAVGDVTGQGAFTHVAMYQAGIVVEEILGHDGHPADYRALPRVTFTDPEIGAVGLTEGQARERGLDVAVGTTPTPSSARGWIHKAGNEGLIKVVVDRRRGVLVGATAMGPHGGEVVGFLAVAVHAEVAVESLRRMIFAYPTFHRGIEDALKAIQ